MPVVLFKKAALALRYGLLFPSNGLAAVSPDMKEIKGEKVSADSPMVGGQALIEGVMMRGPARWTASVRRLDGSITSTSTDYRGWSKRWPILGKPFLRGAMILLESMIIGLKALNFSAEIAAQDEDKVEKSDEFKGNENENAKDTDTPVALEMSAVPETTGTTVTPEIVSEKNISPALGFWALALTLVAAFTLAMALFVALPHVASVFLGLVWDFDESSGLFHLADGLIKFALFLGYVWGIGLLPDIARVYAYHGAEHQAIYTYEAGEPLTPDMAAKHSSLHPRCGTAFIFLVLALSIIFFAAVFPFIFPQTGEATLGRTIWGIVLKIILMLPLAGLAYEVTRLAGRASPSSWWRTIIGPGLLLQRLTTRRPDQAQLEVALKSLKDAVA